jgi:hypothetical protein
MLHGARCQAPGQVSPLYGSVHARSPESHATIVPEIWLIHINFKLRYLLPFISPFTYRPDTALGMAKVQVSFRYSGTLPHWFLTMPPTATAVYLQSYYVLSVLGMAKVQILFWFSVTRCPIQYPGTLPHYFSPCRFVFHWVSLGATIPQLLVYLQSYRRCWVFFGDREWDVKYTRTVAPVRPGQPVRSRTVTSP